MVVHRDAQHLFGAVLSDDVLVEFGFDLLRSVQRNAVPRPGHRLFRKQMGALFDALVANGHPVGTDYYFFDFAVALTAEAAMQFLLKTVHIASYGHFLE